MNLNNRARGRLDFRSVRTLLPLLRPCRREAWFITLLAAVAAASTLLTNFLVGRAVGALTASHLSAGGVVPPAAGILLVGILGAIASHRHAVESSRVAARLTTELQRRVFERRTDESLASITVNPPGRIVNSLLHDVPLVPTFLLNALSIVVASAITVVAVLVAVVYIDYRLLIPIGLMGVLVIPYSRIERQMRAAVIRKISSMAALQVFLEEHMALAGVKLSRNYGLRRLVGRQFDVYFGRLEAASFEMHRTSSLSNALTMSATAGLVAVVLLLGGGAGARDHFGVTGFVILILSIPLLVRVLHDYSTLGYWVSTAAAIVDSLHLAKQEPQTSLRRVKTRMSPTPVDIESDLQAGRAPVIQVRDLTFSYESTRFGADRAEVLRGVTFDVYPGELLAITGHVGTGKSTLALLLAGLLQPSAGTILVRNRLAEKTARGVCLVDHQDLFVSGTISENLRMVDQSLSLARTVEICEAVGAHGFVSKLPQGYETTIGERGMRLSSGQRQLLAIARVIAARPAAVVLDEATTSLDSESEHRAIDGLRRQLDTPTILIAHRFSTIALAHRVIVLSEGTVVAEVSRETLVASSELSGHLGRLYTG